MSVTDANGAVRQFGHDRNGRVTLETDPLGRATTFVYDGGGRLSSRTDPRATTVTFDYHAAGWLAEDTSADGTITYGYDAEDRRTSMTTPTGTVEYGYSHGLLTSVTDHGGGITTYTYDQNSRLESAGFPNGVSADLEYDPVGQLTSLTYLDPSSGALDTFAYSYDPAGNRTSATSNTTTETYVFDELNRSASMMRPQPCATGTSAT